MNLSRSSTLGLRTIALAYVGLLVLVPVLLIFYLALVGLSPIDGNESFTERNSSHAPSLPGRTWPCR